MQQLVKKSMFSNESPACCCRNHISCKNPFALLIKLSLLAAKYKTQVPSKIYGRSKFRCPDKEYEALVPRTAKAALFVVLAGSLDPRYVTTSRSEVSEAERLYKELQLKFPQQSFTETADVWISVQKFALFKTRETFYEILYDDFTELTSEYDDLSANTAIGLAARAFDDANSHLPRSVCRIDTVLLHAEETLYLSFPRSWYIKSMRKRRKNPDELVKFVISLYELHRDEVDLALAKLRVASDVVEDPMYRSAIIRARSQSFFDNLKYELLWREVCMHENRGDCKDRIDICRQKYKSLICKPRDTIIYMEMQKAEQLNAVY